MSFGLSTAPQPDETIEKGIGGLPLVQQQGLNTNQQVNLSGFVISSSGFPTGGIPPADGASTSARCISTGGRGFVSLSAGNNTAFVTTDTYIAEVFIPATVTVNGVAVLMGTAAGNGDIAVALANSAGTIVAQSTASTITTGTSTTYTQVSFATPYVAVGPSTYYVCVQGNSTSDKFMTHLAGNFGASLKTSQTFNTFTNITPPTTFTANQGPVADLF